MNRLRGCRRKEERRKAKRESSKTFWTVGKQKVIEKKQGLVRKCFGSRVNLGKQSPPKEKRMGKRKEERKEKPKEENEPLLYTHFCSSEELIEPTWPEGS